MPEDVETSDKKVQAELRLGLFSYPVLQAADVLVHRCVTLTFSSCEKLMLSSATHVPVGEDQAQHLEFTRECAEAFNRTYGEALPVPQTILCKLDYGYRVHDCSC